VYHNRRSPHGIVGYPAQSFKYPEGVSRVRGHSREKKGELATASCPKKGQQCQNGEAFPDGGERLWIMKRNLYIGLAGKEWEKIHETGEQSKGS